MTLAFGRARETARAALAATTRGQRADYQSRKPGKTSFGYQKLRVPVFGPRPLEVPPRRTRGVPTSRGARTCAAPSTTDGVRGLEAPHYGPSAPREQSASDNHARPTIARPWPATNYSDRRRGANYPSARWASCQRGARFAPRAVARAAAGLGPTGLEPRRIPRSARLLQQARDARQAHGRPVQAGSCGARGQQQAELEHEPPTTSSSRDEHVPADQVDRPLAGRVARAGSRWHRDRHAGDRQSHVVPLLLADGH